YCTKNENTPRKWSFSDLSDGQRSHTNIIQIKKG
ncbi:MAG: hypothetical protein ACI85I_001353, partial [Arenicella sp.]